MILHFEGFSDDTFGETNATGVDHDNCASGEPIDFIVRHEVIGVVVSGQYARGECGGWSIGVAPYDPNSEDAPIPKWPMHFERAPRDYSPKLVIAAPDGPEVVLVE